MQRGLLGRMGRILLTHYIPQLVFIVCVQEINQLRYDSTDSFLNGYVVRGQRYLIPGMPSPSPAIASLGAPKDGSDGGMQAFT